MDGIHVLAPCVLFIRCFLQADSVKLIYETDAVICRSFDTVGILSRDLLSLHRLVKNTMKVHKPTKVCSSPA